MRATGREHGSSSIAGDDGAHDESPDAPHGNAADESGGEVSFRMRYGVGHQPALRARLVPPRSPLASYRFDFRFLSCGTPSGVPWGTPPCRSRRARTVPSGLP